jgi:hypothetical protein
LVDLKLSVEANSVRQHNAVLFSAKTENQQPCTLTTTFDTAIIIIFFISPTATTTHCLAANRFDRNGAQAQSVAGFMATPETMPVQLRRRMGMVSRCCGSIFGAFVGHE